MALKRRESRNRFPEGNRYQPVKPKGVSLLKIFKGLEEELAGPSLQLRGGRVLDIDGCAGVLACDDNIIRLRLKDTVLTVLGSNLQVLDFSAYTLTVTGDIRSIELDPLPKRKGAGK